MLFSSILGGKSIEVPIIESFDLNRFIGTWYEIARLDHPYERGLERVTAQYQFDSKGIVTLINQGFKSNNKHTRRHGKLLPTTTPNYFKVYFGFPIGFHYRVAYIDNEYSLTIITGARSNTLWFMARSKTITSEQKQQLERLATQLGFDVSKLIYTKQQ